MVMIYDIGVINFYLTYVKMHHSLSHYRFRTEHHTGSALNCLIAGPGIILQN